MFNKSKQSKSTAPSPRPIAAPVPRVQQSPTPRPAAAAEADAPGLQTPGTSSIISNALRVTGNLDCDGDIEIKGTIDGDVKARNVRIDESGKVKGKITAESAYVDGTVRGQIVARTVALASSANVRGDIVHETLSIEAGAFLDGNCRRLSEKDSVPARPKPPSRPRTKSQPRSQPLNDSAATAKPEAGAPAA